MPELIVITIINKQRNANGPFILTAEFFWEVIVGEAVSFPTGSFNEKKKAAAKLRIDSPSPNWADPKVAAMLSGIIKKFEKMRQSAIILSLSSFEQYSLK